MRKGSQHEFEGLSLEGERGPSSRHARVRRAVREALAVSAMNWKCSAGRQHVTPSSPTLVRSEVLKKSVLADERN